jgi:hypothetical protein
LTSPDRGETTPLLGDPGGHEWAANDCLTLSASLAA